MNKKTIRDVDLSDHRVLVRVDFNVPLEDGKVADDTRITAAVPTIKAILDEKPKAVILMSHLGRPKGEPKPEFSLAPVAPILAEKLGMDVQFVDATVGEKVTHALDLLPDGGVLLLENTRFNPGEKANDPQFAEQLSAFADIYVNDAFGSAHRAHASTVGITEHVAAVAGLLMEKEIEFLNNALENPDRPFAAILGGAKVSDKIAVIERLLDLADVILIGGGMANTFFAAKELALGDSLVEEDAVETAKSLLEKGGDKLVLPTDTVIADAFEATANSQVITVSEGVPDGWRILDIGPETVARFAAQLDDAQTIVWNGPMGVFEFDAFAVGTNEIAEVCAEQADDGSVVIIGGGDSAAAIRQAGLTSRVTHVSTGGGASLEMLEGKTLPGLAALNDK